VLLLPFLRRFLPWMLPYNRPRPSRGSPRLLLTLLTVALLVLWRWSRRPAGAGLALPQAPEATPALPARPEVPVAAPSTPAERVPAARAADQPAAERPTAAARPRLEPVEVVEPVVEDPAAAPGAVPPPAGPDNLQAIEGIGPRINGLLHEHGILTFAQLARTDLARLREILDEARLRYIKPDTWPEQAGLAAAGRWDDLKALQSQLKGGARQD
jgi:predicted flap endonuclease-1-like 5' DNA nuclease